MWSLMFPSCYACYYANPPNENGTWGKWEVGNVLLPVPSNQLIKCTQANRSNFHRIIESILFTSIPSVPYLVGISADGDAFIITWDVIPVACLRSFLFHSNFHAAFPKSSEVVWLIWSPEIFANRHQQALL